MAVGDDDDDNDNFQTCTKIGKLYNVTSICQDFATLDSLLIFANVFNADTKFHVFPCILKKGL